MKNKINEFVNKHNLIEDNDCILIAFSGGADSVFLSEYLLSIRDEKKLTLKIAHVEHGIRGDESLHDCEFSKNFAKRNNIEFFELHINAVEEAKRAGLGVEEYSRIKRYEFFNTICCDKIATAHNLTDNVETFLFRCARGTSLNGLCSIPIKRGKIIRPLLCVSSSEIRNFLNDNDLDYCIDNTNSNNDYSRNRIRNSVLPEFKKINSEYEKNIARLINSLNEDNSFINAQVEDAYLNVKNKHGVDINKITQLDLSVQNRILIKFASENDINLDEFHLNLLINLLYNNGKCQLKGDIFAISSAGFLRIIDFNCNNNDLSQLIVNKTVLPFNEFLNKCELLNKKFDFYCDCDKISGKVFVRYRKSGDYITPAKRNCKKTLKKLYNEYHIPVEQRNKIPVICDDIGVIGIYGYCVDARVACDNSTRDILLLEIPGFTEENI